MKFSYTFTQRQCLIRSIGEDLHLHSQLPPLSVIPQGKTRDAQTPLDISAQTSTACLQTFTEVNSAQAFFVISVIQLTALRIAQAILPLRSALQQFCYDKGAEIKPFHHIIPLMPMWVFKVKYSEGFKLCSTFLIRSRRTHPGSKFSTSAQTEHATGLKFSGLPWVRPPC